jgi:hypothetical protein
VPVDDAPDEALDLLWDAYEDAITPAQSRDAAIALGRHLVPDFGKMLDLPDNGGNVLACVESTANFPGLADMLRTPVDLAGVAASCSYQTAETSAQERIENRAYAITLLQDALALVRRWDAKDSFHEFGKSQ